MSKNTKRISFAEISEVYRDIRRFLIPGRHATEGVKSASVLALELLAREQPMLAKEIFEKTAVRGLHLALKLRDPPVEISLEGEAFLEDLRERFLQQPLETLLLLEAVFVAEKAESILAYHARDYGPGFSFDEVQSDPVYYGKIHEKVNVFLYAQLGSYVRERDYRISFELVSNLTGSNVDALVEQALVDLPPVLWDDVGLAGDTAQSLLGRSGIANVFAWSKGEPEF